MDKLNGASSPDWLQAVRKAGRARFGELDFPNRRMEAWRFTNVAPILGHPFRSAVAAKPCTLGAEDVKPFLYHEPDWIELVFVDGYFVPALSRQTAAAPVHAGGLAASQGPQAELLRTHLGRHVNLSNAFCALNSAFLQDGAVVHIPRDRVVEAPVHLVFVTTPASRDTAIYPRNVIVAGEQSAARVVESYVHLAGDAPYFTNAVSEVVLESGARLDHFRVLHEGTQSFHLASVQYHLGRDTHLESFVVTLEGRITRNEVGVLFDGEGAEVALHGLYLNDRDRLIDNAIFIDHAKPRCRSRITYKGVLGGTSHGVFTGKVNVRPHAQKTDSDQLNSTLLLSDGATIDTKPQLEIFADDVKCTHGATVGQHPEEVVFYFRTRGMSEVMARGMLTYGFAGEIVEAVGIGPLRDRLDAFVFDRYSP